MMRQKWLVSCWWPKKRKVCTTDSHYDHPVEPNQLNRDFVVTTPNPIEVCDITGIWTEESWQYLSVLMDVYARAIVGWAMDEATR